MAAAGPTAAAGRPRWTGLCYSPGGPGEHPRGEGHGAQGERDGETAWGRDEEASGGCAQVYHAANLGRLDSLYRPAGVFVQRGDGLANHMV